MSVGFDVVYPVLDEAVGQLSALNATVIVVSGNDAFNACLASLESAPRALAGGAIDHNGGQAQFSNHGLCVKLWAEGVDLNSSWHTGPSDYKTLSGTFMSTLLVAGISARIMSKDSKFPKSIISAELITMSTKTIRGNISVPQE